MGIKKRNHGRIALVVTLVLWLTGSMAFAQTQPPGPTFIHQFRTAGLPQPERFQLVHSLLHFEPGAATPMHQHPGQVVVTVLEGENTFLRNGVEHGYKAGESFIEVPGEVTQARNAGATRMSVMATYLLPWDAPLSKPEPGDQTPPPRPFASYQFKTDVAPMPGPFDVVQAILEFAPGAATPYHTHPGIVMVTVIEGELTFHLEGRDQRYKAGESFVEVPEQVGQARNASAARVRVMASYLLPQGAPLSVPRAAPAMPAPLPATGVEHPRAPAGAARPAALPVTGAGGPGTLVPWLALAGVIVLIASGWALRRRQR